MAKTHGKNTAFLLDDLDGALQNIRASLDTVSWNAGSDRPDTSTFGQRGLRREVLGQRRATISFGGFYKQSTLKVHGRNTRVLLDEFSVSGKLTSVTVRRINNYPLTSTFGVNFDEHDAGASGLLDGAFNFTGPYDGGAAEIDDILRAAAAQEAATVCSVAPNGFPIGNLVEMAALVPSANPINSPVQDLTTVSLEAPVDDGVELGVALHDLTAETAVGDYASVDETEASANGGVAHLHVTAYTGTTALLKVQHSTDNAVWVDLVTFAAVTAVGHERVEVAAGTTVNRYLRGQIFSETMTTMTFVIAFARRDFAYGTAGTHRHFCGLYGKQTSSSFQYGPHGSAVGAHRRTGELVMTSYDVTYNTADVTRFTGEFMTTGTITEDTF